jgi:type IV secretion system protein VirB8
MLRPPRSDPEPTPAQQAIERFFDWDYDLQGSATRRARWALIFAGCCLLVAVVSVGAVAALAPLKTVEPIFVRVDAQTGAIDVLQRIEEAVGVGRQEALDKGFLARYVRAREGYFYPALERDYRTVLLMSVGTAKARFQQATAADNPEAPVNHYRDQVAVEVRIASIAILAPGLAQVRYRTLRKEHDQQDQVRAWIATLRYTYEPNAQIPLGVLAENPLGFAVSDYRAEPEAL